MRYKIHEVAKMMGVSPQTLRFYEQYGIQVNERVGDGKYRQYSDTNMDMLMSLKKCRNCGFTIAQASRVLREEDDSRLCGVLHERANSMSRQAEVMSRRAQALSATAERMRDIENRLDCFEECIRPVFYMKTILTGQGASVGQKEMREVSAWAEWLPITVWFTRCSVDDLKEGTCMQRGFMLDEENAVFLDVCGLPGVERSEERRCLHAVMRWNSAEGGVLSCMRRGVQAAENRGLHLTGDLIVKTIWNIDGMKMPISYGDFYFSLN